LATFMRSSDTFANGLWTQAVMRRQLKCLYINGNYTPSMQTSASLKTEACSRSDAGCLVALLSAKVIPATETVRNFEVIFRADVTEEVHEKLLSLVLREKDIKRSCRRPRQQYRVATSWKTWKRWRIMG